MIQAVFTVLGSLGVFLFGMRIMSEAVQKLGGEKFQNLLNVMTYNRIAGVLTGLTITGIIQSSSATTVILVSLVNAGLMTLPKAISVIMGANIGTTLTAWIVSLFGFKFHISEFAYPAIAVSLPFLFSKFEKRRRWGELLIGFGILFLGLDLLKESVPDIRGNIEVLTFLKHASGYGYLSIFLAVAVGTLVTIVVQSSSAAMAITITMAYKGWIDFPVAAGFVLGENIGTTITAFLASLGMNTTARRAARSHMLFNLIGVAWMLIVFYPFIGMLDSLIPGSIDNPANLPVLLSAFHSSFNILNTALLVWFIPQIARVVEHWIPDRADDASRSYKLQTIGPAFADFAEVNLNLARKEVGKMASLVSEMLLLFLNSARGGPKTTSQVSRTVLLNGETSERMYEEISKFLAACRAEVISDKQGASVNALLLTVSELRSIANACESMIALVQHKEKKKLKFHKTAWEEIVDYGGEVLDFLKYNTNFLNQELTPQDLNLALKMENAINDKRTRLRKLAQNKMAKGSDIQGELVYMELIKHLEHIGDFSLTIAQTLKEISAADVSGG